MLGTLVSEVLNNIDANQLSEKHKIPHTNHIVKTVVNI